MSRFIPHSIIPAQGWAAVFEDGEGIIHVPLVCWSLGSSEGNVAIHGMIGDENGVIESATNADNFINYVFEIDDYEIESELLN